MKHIKKERKEHDDKRKQVKLQLEYLKEFKEDYTKMKKELEIKNNTVCMIVSCPLNFALSYCFCVG